MRPKTIKLLGIQAGVGAGVPGAEYGPGELRARGLIQRLSRDGHNVLDIGDVPGNYETRYFSAGNVADVRNLPRILQVNRHTHACVVTERRQMPEAFLLIVGGDHSLAIGTLAGLSDCCERLGILWIDAHADFNTPATSPSGNIHGMSLAVACGHGLLDLRQISMFDPIAIEDDVYLFGPRDIDEGERENLAESTVHWWTTQQWRDRGIAASVLEACDALAGRCDHIHLSFDIDVLDPGAGLATGTPVPGGISLDEAKSLLATLSERDVIRSAEFVEYNPELDPEGVTAERTLELIDALFAVK